MIVQLIVTSIFLGIGLAMDAFSVSLANGLNEPKMKPARMSLISGVFGLFQFAMPLLGWVCVAFFVDKFRSFEKYIPWIALILLLYIGGKLLIDGIRGEDDAETSASRLGFGALLIQGVATSIDALSVGFTISEYKLAEAFLSAVIIGVVTFFICMAGLILGKKFGTRLAGKAQIFGGVILILIGIEIMVKGVFF